MNKSINKSAGPLNKPQVQKKKKINVLDFAPYE